MASGPAAGGEPGAAGRGRRLPLAGARPHQAAWAVRSLGESPLDLFAEAAGDHRPKPDVALPAMRFGEHVTQDYLTTSMSLKAHPTSLSGAIWRSAASSRRARWWRSAPGRRIETVGVELVRQQPDTASGVIFITIENETGVTNLICWPDIIRKYRKADGFMLIMKARAVARPA